MPAALITVAALGLPLLCGLYIRESGVVRDIPGSALALTVGLGIGLGVGWVLADRPAVARAYGVPLGAGSPGPHPARRTSAFPLGSMLLMLVPAVAAGLSLAR
jgi:hypothetical protein